MRRLTQVPHIPKSIQKLHRLSMNASKRSSEAGSEQRINDRVMGLLQFVVKQIVPFLLRVTFKECGEARTICDQAQVENFRLATLTEFCSVANATNHVKVRSRVAFRIFDFAEEHNLNMRSGKRKQSRRGRTISAIVTASAKREHRLSRYVAGQTLGHDSSHRRRGGFHEHQRWCAIPLGSQTINLAHLRGGDNSLHVTMIRRRLRKGQLPRAGKDASVGHEGYLRGVPKTKRAAEVF